MNCRHCNLPWETEYEYCPDCNRNFGGAVYPNFDTPNEVANTNELIAYIQEAFHGVRLGNGQTIHEADLEGCYTDDSVRLNARAKDTETDWRDIPDSKLASFSSVVCFFDPEAYRFYIPAYMIWTLKNWRTSDLHIVDSVLWSFGYKYGPFDDERRLIFSPTQLHAAYRFMKHFCDFSGDEEQLHAMETYWYKYANPPES